MLTLITLSFQFFFFKILQTLNRVILREINSVFKIKMVKMTTLSKLTYQNDKKIKLNELSQSNSKILNKLQLAQLIKFG